MHTEYRVCLRTEDYAFCQAKVTEWEGPDPERYPLAFPTVMAWREERMIGYLGTIFVGDRVCAGPLAMDPTLRSKGLVARRLVAYYEDWLRSAGVTTYSFSIDTKNPWYQVVRRFGEREHSTQGTYAWFTRQLA